jgi:hypothetical protein
MSEVVILAVGGVLFALVDVFVSSPRRRKRPRQTYQAERAERDRVRFEISRENGCNRRNQEPGHHTGARRSSGGRQIAA